MPKGDVFEGLNDAETLYIYSKTGFATLRTNKKNDLKWMPRATSGSIFEIWGGFQKYNCLDVFLSARSWPRICKMRALAAKVVRWRNFWCGSAQGAGILESVSRVVTILHEFRPGSCTLTPLQVVGGGSSGASTAAPVIAV